MSEFGEEVVLNWEEDARSLLRDVRKYERLQWKALADLIEESYELVTDVAWDRVKPSRRLYDNLLRFCRERKLPAEASPVWRRNLERKKADGPGEASEFGTSQRERGLISTLGLGSADLEESKNYAGSYLHLLLDEDGEVVVTRCHLRSKLART